MRTFFTSLMSAILGALIVYGAFTVAPPERRDSSPDRALEVAAPAETAGENSTPGELTAQQIYTQYGDAVVHVKATVSSTYENFFGIPVPDNQVSSGSGFIVSEDGYVITNAHVVSGADKISIQFSDKAEVTAEIIGTDVSTDVAVLKADIQGHKTGTLDLGDSRNAQVGQTVYAIGNPLGYDRSMSQGIISALNRIINAPNGLEIRDVIQTDAAVNQGNSGGPLVTSSGKVIGVTSQIATTGQGNIGIAFAIPSATVKKVFNEIKRTGKTSRPWIGIRGATLEPEMAKRLGLKSESGAIIVSLIEPGPAQDAGLRESDGQTLIDNEYVDVGGDIITKVNKSQIGSMEDLVNEINQYSAGETITLTILRAGKFKKISLKLSERPAKFDEPQLTR